MLRLRGSGQGIDDLLLEYSRRCDALTHRYARCALSNGTRLELQEPAGTAATRSEPCPAPEAEAQRRHSRQLLRGPATGSGRGCLQQASDSRLPGAPGPDMLAEQEQEPVGGELGEVCWNDVSDSLS